MVSKGNLFKKGQYNKMVAERSYSPYNTYGKVLIVSTKTLKYTLNILETVIPMTFFTLSILATMIYKKYGYKELIRITIKDE